MKKNFSLEIRIYKIQQSRLTFQDARQLEPKTAPCSTFDIRRKHVLEAGQFAFRRRFIWLSFIFWQPEEFSPKINNEYSGFWMILPNVEGWFLRLTEDESHPTIVCLFFESKKWTGAIFPQKQWVLRVLDDGCSSCRKTIFRSSEDSAHGWFLRPTDLPKDAGIITEQPQE